MQVPDRGGRPRETRPPPEMPAFKKRTEGPKDQRQRGGGAGGGKGGGGGKGRGGRVQGGELSGTRGTVDFSCVRTVRVVFTYSVGLKGI
jgi:hypothetical protein